jgi:alpha-L-rhamnosidase
MSSDTVYHLTCEYRENPLGIDVTHPRLGWQLRSGRRGARQSAYQITAASSPAALEEPELLWDSGRVESDRSAHIAYAGPPLSSRQRVHWRVIVWDERGERTVSDPAWWEMGLLEQADWQGDWIGGPLSGGPRTTSPAPFLRREFTAVKPVAKARLYATAIGLYECWLNGARVGEDVLTPGWTDYHMRIQYQVYDVTSLIQPGENVIGAILGDGWAVGHIAWVGRQRYADRPQFLAQLEITFADGSRQVIATDGDWLVSTGPILESDLLMGESYDARRELTGWDTPGYDATQWCPAVTFSDNGAALVATNGPAVRRQEELRPAVIRYHPDFANPRWVVDFGQNLVGRVRLKVSGPAGTTVSIRHSEALNPDGTIYTANLRTARNTDFYTLKGGGEEVYEPRFAFHGFRYVELGGFPGAPAQDTITAIVIHSDMPVRGSFECSDPLINRLQKNIVWSQKGNFIDVPTDCPQRDERLGWTGDAQVFISTAAFNMDVAGFFGKWMQDLEDAQNPTGSYPAIAPNPGVWPIAEGGPAWADAGIIIPWTIYRHYGDTRILERHYDSMRRFVDFLTETSRGNLRCYPDYEGWQGFGDWLALDGSNTRQGATSKELIGTAFYAYSTRLMAEIAGLLGKTGDAERFARLSNDIRGAFFEKFVNSDGTIIGGTQTAYVLALHFDLLPEHLRPSAAAEIVRDIRRRDGHLSTGFVGTPYINWVLSEMGYIDVAYELLKQTTWPSWLYSITQEATTIWERWDGWTHDKGFQDPAMNSFNHYAYGAIGSWLYATVAGIDLDPERPGYKHIIMRPRPGGSLTSAAAELETPYGTIRSAWTLKDGSLDWRICVPASTTATVFVPLSGSSEVWEGDELAESADRVSRLSHDKNIAAFEIGSGDYHFTTHPPP